MEPEKPLRLRRPRRARVLAGAFLVWLALTVVVGAWIAYTGWRERHWHAPKVAEPAREVANYKALRAAICLARPPRDQRLIAEGKATDPRDDPGLAAARRFVADNAPMRARLREALAKPCWVPDLYSGAGDMKAEAGIEMQAIQQFTVVTQALRQASLVAWADRDWPGAAEPLLDGVALGLANTRGSGDRALLGVSSASVMASRLARLAPHLDAATALATAHRLEALIDAAPSLSQQQRWAAPSRAGLLSSITAAEGKHGDFPHVLLLPSPRERYRRATAYLEAIAIDSDKPRDQWRLPPAAPLYWSARMADMLRALSDTALRPTVVLRVLLTEVAIDAYHAEHGAYPATLTELVPRYLKRLPDDGYTAGPVRYRRTADSFVCYSVGPDLRDDGGKPLAKAKSVVPFAATGGEGESEGDLVSQNVKQR